MSFKSSENWYLDIELFTGNYLLFMHFIINYSI